MTNKEIVQFNIERSIQAKNAGMLKLAKEYFDEAKEYATTEKLKQIIEKIRQ